MSHNTKCNDSFQSELSKIKSYERDYLTNFNKLEYPHKPVSEILDNKLIVCDLCYLVNRFLLSLISALMLVRAREHDTR
jgi:hypothetical protein